MCYDIKATLEAQLLRAKRRNDLQAIEEIIEKLLPYTDLPLHHVSGFNHPSLLIYTDRSPDFPEVSSWGLVPHWFKNLDHLTKLQNSTLNAKSETIFEKPSFRDSARNNRCLVFVDGFYEHHHYKNQVYPFFIHKKDRSPIALAGLFSEWRNPETKGLINSFTIVTCEGTSLLKKIHNNPKLKGPRMPLILEEDLEEQWLKSEVNDTNIEELIKASHSNLESKLTAHTVNKLRGKSYLGNVNNVDEEFIYEELEF